MSVSWKTCKEHDICFEHSAQDCHSHSLGTEIVANTDLNWTKSYNICGVHQVYAIFRYQKVESTVCSWRALLSWMIADEASRAPLYQPPLKKETTILQPETTTTATTTTTTTLTTATTTATAAMTTVTSNSAPPAARKRRKSVPEHSKKLALPHKVLTAAL